jgi:tetratricopeptide (TPR) repeat protein
MADAMQLAGEQSSDAHLARGAVYYDLEDLDAARRDLETAVRLNPESAQALAQLGRLNLRQGRVEAAAQALDAARRHAPHDLQLGTLRGLLALARNDFAQALAELSESIAINATQPLPFAARGQVHEAQGRREQAIADFQAALARRAVDNDGQQAQQLARERLAALRAAPRGETGGLDTARSDGNGEHGRSGAVERHAGRRPPVGADADGRPASLVCRMVEGLFGSARHYTGVEFDTGCRPERVQASRGQAQ